MTTRFNVGDRVRVNITKPDAWATGAAQALNGTIGTVESVKPAVDPRGWRSGPPETPYLVRFDAPGKTWWTNQSAPLAFHFDAHDLEVLT